MQLADTVELVHGVSLRRLMIQMIPRHRGIFLALIHVPGRTD